jgi:hypothetical protein
MSANPTRIVAQEFIGVAHHGMIQVLAATYPSFRDYLLRASSERWLQAQAIAGPSAVRVQFEYDLIGPCSNGTAISLSFDHQPIICPRRHGTS